MSEYIMLPTPLIRISRGIVVETSSLIFSKNWIMPTGKVKFYREDNGYGL